MSSSLNRYVSDVRSDVRRRLLGAAEAALMLALAAAAGCQSAPPRPSAPATFEAPASVAVKPSAAPAAAPSPAANGTPPGTMPSPEIEVPVPERAAQQYAQALQLLKSGRGSDAELEFKQLALAYPQFAGPEINLGLIYLKASRLPEAEAAFKAALERSPANSVAGNGLGIAQRRLGKFKDAEASYQRTIATEPNYAPAHLNLGVLYDLYLAQPQKALEQFQRYIEIAGENKQVSGWVIELRKRVGTPAAAAKKEPA